LRYSTIRMWQPEGQGLPMLTPSSQPNAAGYAVMMPLAARAIEQTLAGR
jgi:hypothetical protein